AEGPVLYPEGRRHSPITGEVAAHLRAIADAGPGQDDHVFAKIGDSITEGAGFLRCFDGGKVDLDGRRRLRATIDHFLAGDADGVSPFARASVAAVSGWSARGPLDGTPSYLDQELATLAPRYATVMFGTNDVDYRGHDRFASDLWTIVDTLIDHGVVPVLSTIPPRDDDAEVDARVPVFNQLIRALAQGRQIPLVDFHAELMALPDHGLWRDGVHPSTSHHGACDLTAEGLQSGYDVRNLITLEGLDRARRAVAGEAAPDHEATHRLGRGSHDDPFVADGATVDLGDTRGGERLIDRYDGCGADQDERGPEIVYRLDLDHEAVVEAYVVDRDDTDVDVHILAGDLDGAACVGRGHQDASATVGPGPVYVVVDSFTDADGTAHAGEYLLAIRTR
ncbi:MAG: SGNH/GDSL hydrolase family protein, partial [Myxococcales bacterium]|nr:SGNH/GDSL hydrolase family protein [Myxococcales bacterium]